MSNASHALWRPLGALACLAVVLLSAPADAQQEKPAAPPATEQPAGDQPVTLAFKYKTGQLQSLRASVKSELSLSPEGGAGGGAIGALPISNSMVFAYSERVTGTRQGTGTLAVTVNSMTMNMNMLGNETVIRVNHGKVSGSRNGQPVPAAEMARFSKSLQGLASGEETVVRRSPQGKDTPVNAAGKKAAMGNPVNADVVLLPDKPVKIGDTWEHTAKVRPQLPSVPGGGAGQEVEVHFTYTLKDIETKNGKQLAVIETDGSSSAEPAKGGAGPGSSQSYTGTTYFDINRGQIASGQYTITIAMSVPLTGFAAAAGAAAGAGGNLPASMHVDGTTEVKVAEAPPAPAAKPGAKKATRKGKK